MQSPFPRHRREFKFLIHSLASCYSQVLWNPAWQRTSEGVTEVPKHIVQRLGWTIQRSLFQINAGTFTSLNQAQSVALPLFWAENPICFSQTAFRASCKMPKIAATQFLLIIFTYYKLILQFGNSCKQTQNRIRTSTLKAGHYHYPGIAGGWKS